jgi:hypothetical protein
MSPKLFVFFLNMCIKKLLKFLRPHICFGHFRTFSNYEANIEKKVSQSWFGIIFTPAFS